MSYSLPFWENSPHSVKIFRMQKKTELWWVVVAEIIYQEGVYYMEIKVFNNLPPHSKDISDNVKKFEHCLR
jgi:hypothetical protein